jgi:NAD(P)-dependent dehydrogenase (short-subunit alcohol dehydrogenase family)
MSRQHQARGRTTDWTAADIPDQSGRIAVITGGSSGIGLETARVLTARGAQVVLACRNLAKATQAGYPVAVRSSAPSYDLANAARLWEISEQLTSITYSHARAS